MKTINIPLTLRDYIEGLNYEKQSRLNLILFMLNNNKNMNGMFDKITNEYKEFFICCELAKQNLNNSYIKPVAVDCLSWNLDFKTSEVHIHE